MRVDQSVPARPVGGMRFRLLTATLFALLLAGCSDDPPPFNPTVDSGGQDAVDDATDVVIDADDVASDAILDGDDDVSDSERDGADDTTAEDTAPDTPPEDADDDVPPADVAEDAAPDASEPTTCERSVFSGQIGGVPSESNAFGGVLRSEPIAGYDAGLRAMQNALVDAGFTGPIEGRWAFTAATISATAERSVNGDFAQRQFWLQDGDMNVAAYLIDEGQFAPFPIRVGQRVSGVATRLDVFDDRISITGVDADAWSLVSEGNEVYVGDSFLNTIDGNAMYRQTGRLVEVVDEDCGGGARCFRMTFRNAASGISFRTFDPALEVGQCITFTGPVNYYNAGAIPGLQLNAVNRAWVDVTCDGLSPEDLVNTPCGLTCNGGLTDPICESEFPGGNTCFGTDFGAQCGPVGDGAGGELCDDTTDCVAGAVCESGVCTPLCTTLTPDLNCPDGLACVRFRDGLGFCRRPCLEYGTCGDGFACRPLDPRSAGIQGACIAAGEGQDEAPCDSDADCTEQFICDNALQAGGECQRVCDFADALRGEEVCDFDDACVQTNNGIGVCRDECQLANGDADCAGGADGTRCLDVETVGGLGVCAERGMLPTGAQCPRPDGGGFGYCDGFCAMTSGDPDLGRCVDFCDPWAEVDGADSGCGGDDRCALIGVGVGVCIGPDVPFVRSVGGECRSSFELCGAQQICLPEPGSSPVNSVCTILCRGGEDDCRNVDGSDRWLCTSDSPGNFGTCVFR